jgi:hypothetical protein
VKLAINHAAALREAWLSRRPVRVTLTKRCATPVIVGRVSAVSVTGEGVTIDGWHVPVAAITDIGRATLGDVEDYAHAMHELREQAGVPHDQ